MMVNFGVCVLAEVGADIHVCVEKTELPLAANPAVLG